MQIALWIIWILVPVTYLLMAVWAKLEQIGKKSRKHPREAGELFRQAVFTSACVAIAFFIDIFMLEQAIEPLLPSFLPIGIVKILLLPIILYLAALMVGGKKQVRIESAKRPYKKDGRRTK